MNDVTLSIQMTRELKTKLKKAAKTQRRSMSAQASIFLEEGLRRPVFFSPGSKSPSPIEAKS